MFSCICFLTIVFFFNRSLLNSVVMRLMTSSTTRRSKLEKFLHSCRPFMLCLRTVRCRWFASSRCLCLCHCHCQPLRRANTPFRNRKSNGVAATCASTSRMRLHIRLRVKRSARVTRRASNSDAHWTSLAPGSLTRAPTAAACSSRRSHRHRRAMRRVKRTRHNLQLQLKCSRSRQS